MTQDSAQNVQRDVSFRAFMMLAIVFFIVITMVTFIPVPPALIGYIFAFVFGARYMRSSSRSLARIIFLGGVCGFGTLIALLTLRATILSFLSPIMLFLAGGTPVFFWLGSLWGYKMEKQPDSHR